MYSCVSRTGTSSEWRCTCPKSFRFVRYVSISFAPIMSSRSLAISKASPPTLLPIRQLSSVFNHLSSKSILSSSFKWLVVLVFLVNHRSWPLVWHCKSLSQPSFSVPISSVRLFLLAHIWSFTIVRHPHLPVLADRDLFNIFSPPYVFFFCQRPTERPRLTYFNPVVRVFLPLLRLRLQALAVRLRSRLLLHPAPKRARIFTKWLDALSPVGKSPFEVKCVLTSPMTFDNSANLLRTRRYTYTTYATPDDCDYNFHLSNSCYGKSLDAARLGYVLELNAEFFR